MITGKRRAFASAPSASSATHASVDVRSGPLRPDHPDGTDDADDAESIAVILPVLPIHSDKPWSGSPKASLAVNTAEKQRAQSMTASDRVHATSSAQATCLLYGLPSRPDWVRSAKNWGQVAPGDEYTHIRPRPRGSAQADLYAFQLCAVR
jgi:hypothetical protein